MKLNQLALVCIGSVIFLSSCVSTKKHEELNSAYNLLQGKYENLNVKSTEQLTKIQQLENEVSKLSAEIAQLKEEQDILIRRNQERAELQAKFKDASQKEMQDLLRKIQENEETLQQKEDELGDRTKSLIELQAALKKNEENVKALRKKVSDALLGFEGKDLTVHVKNGKVYVSMEEKLLFRSGSYNLERAGIQALQEMAKVLEQSPDINVLIEGHTDNVPFSGSGQLNDNWDLSVKRATTVARELLKNSSISPNRITAAGRGEFVPLLSNDTREGRQKNRRTEIILTPKLDELLEILETN